MFKNYVKLALRNLVKNKLYAAINVFGLAIGLSIYLFSTLMTDYELEYDRFFENSDRIYTIGSLFHPNANVGAKGSDGIYTAIGPLIKSDFEEIELMARSVRREYLLSMDDRGFYETIKFVDPQFKDIFDFEYLYGDASAFDDPSAIILMENRAKKYFGDENPIGKTISLDNKHDFHVGAVIKELPRNSHLSTALINMGLLNVTINMEALNRIADFPLEGAWDNLSMGDLTYFQLPEHLGKDWFQGQMEGVRERHFPEGTKEFIVGMKVRNLTETNTIMWDMTGLPVIESIKILGILILIVACVNYTNLATAQALGRAREVGLRKTLGAGQGQLLAQFLVESISISIIAMAIAIGILETIIPLYNDATGKEMIMNYNELSLWLIGTTLTVGLISGFYPAHLITRTNAMEALRDTAKKGMKGSRFRSLMIIVQFGLSIFMLATVAVMYFQNLKIEESSNIFPKDQILYLNRVGVEDIRPKFDTLKNELLALPGVENVSYTSQVPFDQSNSTFPVSRQRADKAGEVTINQIIGDYNFFETLGINLVAGRNFSKEVAMDFRGRDENGFMPNTLNVIVNELAIRRLGFSSPEEAVGQSFFELQGEENTNPPQYNIIGVAKDINYLGNHNEINPMIFYVDPLVYRSAIVKLKGGQIPETVQEIENVWKEIIPEYPIQTQFMDEVFKFIFSIFQLMNSALAGFATIALILALIGLFGLAAFMAEQKTKEIGIRKVMGASVPQIIKQMIWQFSKPVAWALIFALPLAYFISGFYLNFFADRIGLPIDIILGAGLLTIVFSWATVALHASRVAHTNPITALRYE